MKTTTGETMKTTVTTLWVAKFYTQDYAQIQRIFIAAATGEKALAMLKETYPTAELRSIGRAMNGDVIVNDPGVEEPKP